MTLLTATKYTTDQNQNEKPNDEKKNQRIPLAEAMKNITSIATNAIEPLFAIEATVSNTPIKCGYAFDFPFSSAKVFCQGGMLRNIFGICGRANVLINLFDRFPRNFPCRCFVPLERTTVHHVCRHSAEG